MLRKYLLKERSTLEDSFKLIHIRKDVSKQQITHRCTTVRPTILGNQLNTTSLPQLRSLYSISTYQFWQYLGFTHHKSLEKKNNKKISLFLRVLVWKIWKLSWVYIIIWGLRDSTKLRGEFHFYKTLKQWINAYNAIKCGKSNLFMSISVPEIKHFLWFLPRWINQNWESMFVFSLWLDFELELYKDICH